jgi:hypothetical protein
MNGELASLPSIDKLSWVLNSVMMLFFGNEDA